MTVIGTAAWAVALVILLILHDQLPADGQWWIWTCVAGVCMGLFALWYVPRFKRARARKAEQRLAARATVTVQEGVTAPAQESATALMEGPDGGQPWSSDSKTVSSTETPG